LRGEGGCHQNGGSNNFDGFHAYLARLTDLQQKAENVPT
jgi:hypothetical protein